MRGSCSCNTLIAMCCLLGCLSTPLLAELESFDSSRLAAEHHFRSAEFGFEFAYPAQFTPRSTDLPGALVLLVHTDESYPTFNVVLQSGPPNLSRDRATRAQQFVNEYKAIGIDSARLISSHEIELHGVAVESFELRYLLSEVPMRSSIQWVPFKDYSLLLTYIDTEQEFESNLELQSAILESFSFLRTPLTNRTVPNNHNRQLSYIIMLVSLLLLLSILIWWFRRAKEL